MQIKNRRSGIVQNLSKMGEVLKYGFFDISSMSTQGSRVRCAKTCLLPVKTHKNRRKTQNSFVPCLTSACPAHRLYRTGSDATAAGGGKRELSEWLRSVCNAAAPSARRTPGTATGKLVGAVTHVLVNDPTTGYGIFIENMIDATT